MATPALGAQPHPCNLLSLPACVANCSFFNSEPALVGAHLCCCCLPCRTSSRYKHAMFAFEAIRTAVHAGSASSCIHLALQVSQIVLFQQQSHGSANMLGGSNQTKLVLAMSEPCLNIPQHALQDVPP